MQILENKPGDRIMEITDLASYALSEQQQQGLRKQG
jgi:hypothetical protein